MLCSVLVPSRARFERLCKTIDSVFETAADPSRVEVIVRLDDDDQDSLNGAAELSEVPNVHFITGPRLGGYAALPLFYDAMSEVAKGEWVWILNDDAFIGRASDHGPGPRAEQLKAQPGRAWDDQLADVPVGWNVIIQAELYRLGGSGYWNHEGSAFPIVAKGRWKELGEPQMRNPVDTWLDRLIRDKHHGRTIFLEDVAVVHERDNDAVLEEHRIL
jgi:hypothetical protein